MSRDIHFKVVRKPSVMAEIKKTLGDIAGVNIDGLHAKIDFLERELAETKLKNRLLSEHECPNQPLVDDIERWRQESEARIATAEARVAILEEQLSEPGYVDALRETLEGVAEVLPPYPEDDEHDFGQMESLPSWVKWALDTVKRELASAEHELNEWKRGDVGKANEYMAQTTIEAERKMREAQTKQAGMAAQLTQTLGLLASANARLALVATPNDGVWLWQGNGDQPESLTCPVVMSAEQLRRLLSSADAGEEAMLDAVGVADNGARCSEREDIVKLMRSHLQFGDQRAVSWHEVEDCIVAINSRPGRLP